MVEDRK